MSDDYPAQGHLKRAKVSVLAARMLLPWTPDVVNTFNHILVALDNCNKVAKRREGQLLLAERAEAS